MNKSVAYIIGAVVVVAIIVIVAMGRDGNDAQMVRSGSEEAAATQSLKQLYASGTPQRCAFEQALADGTRSSGMVYVTQDHLRGDFQTQAGVDGAVIESHLIVEDGTSYVWSSSMPQGVQMSFGEMGAQDTPGTAVSVDQPANYSCAAWEADDTMFNLPDGVTFLDLEAVGAAPVAQ